MTHASLARNVWSELFERRPYSAASRPGSSAKASSSCRGLELARNEAAETAIPDADRLLSLGGPRVSSVLLARHAQRPQRGVQFGVAHGVSRRADRGNALPAMALARMER